MSVIEERQVVVRMYRLDENNVLNSDVEGRGVPRSHSVDVQGTCRMLSPPIPVLTSALACATLAATGRPKLHCACPTSTP